MNWLTLIGSLAAVFALAAVVWFLGMGKAPRIADEDDAKQLARDAHSGFSPRQAAVSRDGRAALVTGSDSDLVLLRSHGARIVARVIHEMPRLDRDEGTLVVNIGERLFGDLNLDLGEGEAVRWQHMLTAARPEIAHE